MPTATAVHAPPSLNRNGAAVRPARHLAVAPSSPPPATARAARGLPPDMMWLALVGPVGALGTFALLSASLVAAVGVGWTVALYAAVVTVTGIVGLRWSR